MPSKTYYSPAINRCGKELHLVPLSGVLQSLDIGNMKTSDHMWLTNVITQILSVVTRANIQILFPGNERDREEGQKGQKRKKEIIKNCPTK